MSKTNSLFNTPPVMAIQMSNLVLQELLNRFPNGLSSIDVLSRKKSRAVYDAISKSPRGFKCPVAPQFRSRMNIVFHGKSVKEEAEFLLEAEKEGMIELKGFNSVGGLRASLNFAITFEDIQKLIKLILKKV